ncbi:MAG: hypothetical protein VX679_01465, partial [Pseudomonadota bacterium]|nr:hypothetical protein [Pseudomonadota bacterium]
AGSRCFGLSENEEYRMLLDKSEAGYGLFHTESPQPDRTPISIIRKPGNAKEILRLAKISHPRNGGFEKVSNGIS